ncbi:sigma-E factor negative regulatory protein [Ramlibacter sp. XY19]|uniref:sigma-E factor negative regulatory protein n=1 Tax=Ramlibacter paludis TaxID=2908000 RepID=UPI0023DB3038|nr:sigma-E factor negative regulatory protein [Ramlibacter paludis]MCG2595244.1 sigma-E factor negative regulatory protein [Ramlibacter paludis]
MDKRELISALADGQLRGDGLARGVDAAASEDGRATWQAYCVIGEVLRSGQACGGSAQGEFLAKLQARLQQEPAHVAAPVMAVAAVRPSGHAAANDWRWKLVAGVASVAAVAAVGWNVWGTAGVGPAAGPQLAAAPAGVLPVAAASDPRAAAMIRDPRLDQLLQAHRQFGGATALQAPSGFLRNATFEGPAR